MTPSIHYQNDPSAVAAKTAIAKCGRSVSSAFVSADMGRVTCRKCWELVTRSPEKIALVPKVGEGFTVFAGRPCRIEVVFNSEGGYVVAYVYEGLVVDEDQEPLGTFDTDAVNTTWES